MSGSDIANNSGFTGCLSKAGIGIGSTPAGLSTAAPNGAGTDFVVAGIAGHFADDATFTINATTTQAVSTSSLYLLQITAAGVTSIKKGNEVLTAELGLIGNSLQWPFPDADNCPLGGFKIALNASTTFTSGTTDLDAAGVTDTFFDFGLGMPSDPETS